VAVHR